MEVPGSPLSSSKFSDISGSPPKLDMSTLAILDNYFTEKAEQERLFQELAAEKAAAEVAGLALDVDEADQDKPMISVTDFKLAFGEDWQLSQFWPIATAFNKTYPLRKEDMETTYGSKFRGPRLKFLKTINKPSPILFWGSYDEKFANRLARNLHDMCTETTNVAFLCCPTAFVAFQHMKPLRTARLLEYDQRFSILSPRQFFPYDMNEPEVFPEELAGKVDIAVIDPPFLNEDTHTKVLKTLRRILHPKSKLIVLTSTSIEDIILRLYDESPLGPLRRTAITVEHGRLANDFACWGSWEGAENFGEEKD